MLQDSKEDGWFRVALEGSQLAAWDWDVKADRVTLSESWSDILGEARRETVTSSRELAELVHPDDLPRVYALLEGAVRGRTPAYDVEHRVRTANGGYRWIQSRGKVIGRDAAGRALRLSGTNADITARRRAEEMLAARELQLRLVTDSVPAMIVEMDADDRIRYCNAKYAEHSGKAQEELVGLTLDEAVGKAAFERFAEQRAKIRSGKQVVYERTDVRAGRPETQLLIQIVPRMQNRSYVGCYLMAEDITERRRLEKMKEDFIRTVSHELRTPLQAIRASLEQIAGAEGSVASVVETARTSCARLVRLVNDILDYQRLRAGHTLPGNAGAIELSTQVREALDANEPLAREAGVALHFAASPVPVPVEAVADRVTQLVTNLVANALKHSERGGSIEISVARSGSGGRVSVRDHGPGVAAEEEAQLFQQFSQGLAKDGKLRSGTGLGLAISKAIAEQMNGRIGFAPAQGGGAVFWFELRGR